MKKTKIILPEKAFGIVYNNRIVAVCSYKSANTIDVMIVPILKMKRKKK